jgi:hypothetical protein
MTRPIHRLYILVAALVLLLGSGTFPAAGNDDTTAVIGPLDLSEFPVISTYLTLNSLDGSFISGITAEQITVLENGQSLPVESFDLIEAGGQFVIAINPGHIFAVRDTNGISRYDKIVAILDSWLAGNPGTGQDDFSLIVAGSQILHVPDTTGWRAALEIPQQNFRGIEPGLEPLALAVDVAADPTAREGMGRAVLFITSPIEPHYALGMQTLAARASEQGIPIHVWLITSDEYLSTNGPGLTKEIAQQTGGELKLFTGSEVMPLPDKYMQSLSKVYRLSYHSRVLGSGENQVSVEVNLGSTVSASQIRTFETNIMPPNPILVAPPDRIVRVGDYEGSEGEIIFDIDQQDLEVLVDFPDGLPRKLVASYLFVDGYPVAENVEPPYNRFSWNIENHQTTATHWIVVEVVDSLGLRGATIETPIEVVVELPKPSLWNIIVPNGPVFAGAAVVLSGAVVLLVLLLGGRIKPPSFERSKRFKKGSNSRVRFDGNQVKNDNGVKPDISPQRRLPNWVNRLQWPHRHSQSKAFAFLVRLSDDGTQNTQPFIPVLTETIVIGSDPLRATMVIEHPSLDPIHAQLRKEKGSYWLSDAGSIAGTWVNYSQVNDEGVLLEHGDIIHIGPVGFRFNLRQPLRQRKPAVIRKEV